MEDWRRRNHNGGERELIQLCRSCTGTYDEQAFMTDHETSQLPTLIARGAWEKGHKVQLVLIMGQRSAFRLALSVSWEATA